MIVHVWVMSDQQIEKELTTSYPALTADERAMIVGYATWRIRIAHELATDDQYRQKIWTLYRLLQKAYATHDLVVAFSWLKQRLKEVWSLSSAIDLIQHIARADPQWSVMSRCIEAKRIARANVNDENIAFRVSCSFADLPTNNAHAS